MRATWLVLGVVLVAGVGWLLVISFAEDDVARDATGPDASAIDASVVTERAANRGAPRSGPSETPDADEGSVPDPVPAVPDGAEARLRSALSPLADLPEKEQWDAAAEFAAQVLADAELREALLQALSDWDEVALLSAMAPVFQWDALGKLSEAEAASLLEMTRNASPVERQRAAACAWATAQMTTRAVDSGPRIAELLGAVADADVELMLATAAQDLDIAGDEASRAALAEAIPRMTSLDAIVRMADAFGRSTAGQDRRRSLAEMWESASTDSAREGIAQSYGKWGLARGGRRPGGRFGVSAYKLDGDEFQRFERIYGATERLDTRRRMAFRVRTAFGLVAADWESAIWRLAALEQDPELRGDLEKLADRIARGDRPNDMELEELLIQE